MNQESTETQVVEAVMINWETIIEDTEKIADEYEAAGWETIVLHPGDVQVVSNESGESGLDVLIPDDEYRELESVLDLGASFDRYEVHSDVLDNIVYLIVTMEDSDTQTGVFYPAYYGLKHTPVIENSRQDGQLRTFLRRLNGEYVKIVHDEPGLFTPLDR
jgi:hypothetical protein